MEKPCIISPYQHLLCYRGWIWHNKAVQKVFQLLKVYNSHMKKFVVFGHSIVNMKVAHLQLVNLLISLNCINIIYL